MSNVNWTEDQKQAITEEGENILVAAAAGSGKTAVLVERIINKIINKNIDINKILVVTFTNAAASEMRERILETIYKKLEEYPENKHLHKQIMLLNKANISTIHAFCLEVIKNNFFEIDISPNFRIADTSEIEILKQEVMENLFENLYESNNKEFLNLIDIYTGYKDDEPLKEIILKIYEYIQSCPFPNDWLLEQINKFDLKDKLEEDFSKTEWGEILLKNFGEEILEYSNQLKIIANKMQRFDELEKFTKTILSDINNLETIIANLGSWDKTFEISNSAVFERWPTDKKVTMELKDEVKEIRDNIKDKYKKSKERIMIYKSIDANKDIYEMYSVLKELQKLVIQFEEQYQNAKKEKNIVDFNDIEHYALKILVKKEKDKVIPTNVAIMYREKFSEIAIDEYQDSNLIQEYILSAISNGKNTFMVGDVKQSIYKFRQACPKLFLDKYEKYKLKNKMQEGENLKIQLFKNFRSKKNILSLTNLVFENLMSKELGEIEYNEEEYLNYGANYEENEELRLLDKSEINIIDLQDVEDENEEEQEDTQENLEKIEIEAKFVANKIKEILESNFYIFDKKVRI